MSQWDSLIEYNYGSLKNFRIDEQVYTLHADSLASKYGFNDGDTPEHVADFFEDVGLDYDWHEILVVLVKKFLVPRLGEVEVYAMETSHNPIRTDTWDDCGNVPDVSVGVTWRNIMDAWAEVSR